MEEQKIEKKVPTKEEQIKKGLIWVLVCAGIISIVIIAYMNQGQEAKKLFNERNAQECKNFNLRYQFLNDSCYECYTVASNFKNMNGTFRVANVMCKINNTQNYNKTMMYATKLD